MKNILRRKIKKAGEQRPERNRWLPRIRPGFRRKGGRGPRRGRLRRVAYWSGVSGVWSLIAGSGLVIYLAQDLPDISDLPPPGREQSAVVLAAGGKRLATYGSIYGDWLDYPDLPEALILALLSVEDRRFFEHRGVDVFGVARAAMTNISAGRVRAGGSTITQQLAKNLFLTPDQTVKRKAQELLLALWLEAEFSKEQILTIYLNRVYFGSGTYGVDAAARKYFDHSARRLSLAEAALLAGLVQAPSAYAPTRNLDRARARAEVVLGAMVDAGYLTEAAATRAIENPAPVAADAIGGHVRYFTDWVVDRLSAMDLPRNKPLLVYTSLNPTVQEAAAQALTKTLPAASDAAAPQGAIVALSPDGAVQAMVGGRSYGESQFNRAAQARRQPGSAFKPFVYLAALEAGLDPDTVMEDAPITIESWSPENFTGAYAGPVRLGEAFARSLNTVAVRVSERAGREAVRSIAKRLGIESDLPPHPSLALGTGDLSPLELVGAYAPFANGGRRARPYAIIEVSTLGGEILYRYRPEPGAQVVAPDDLEAMQRMMRRVVQTGTGQAARIDRPAAGKTGTSQNYRDAWFVGFTRDLVAGVWVGHDEGRAMEGVTGGGLPARIWADFMIDAHLGRPPRPLLGRVREDGNENDGPSFFERLFNQ